MNYKKKYEKYKKNYLKIKKMSGGMMPTFTDPEFQRGMQDGKVAADAGGAEKIWYSVPWREAAYVDGYNFALDNRGAPTATNPMAAPAAQIADRARRAGLY